MKRATSVGVLVPLIAVVLTGVLISCEAFDWGGGVKIKPEGKPFIGTPLEIVAPEKATVGIPAEITLNYSDCATFKMVETRVVLDATSRECTIELWFQSYYIGGDSIPPVALARSRLITVTFPAPGEWNIRSGELSVPITVLAAET